MDTKLTQGCIQDIMRGEIIERPIVQLLDYNRSESSTERFRLTISDGIQLHTYALLASHLNDKIKNGELPENTIISLDRCIPSDLPSGKKVLVIINLTVLEKGDMVEMKIGNPVNYGEIGSTQCPATLDNLSAAHSNDVSFYVSQASSTTNGKLLADNYTSLDTSFGSVDDSRGILPIIEINPYLENWTIRARVASKSKVKTWCNPTTGTGVYFKMELTDESGAITAIAFKKECEKFYDKIKVNQVYYISHCTIKPSKQNFTTIPHDFSLNFNHGTQVVLCSEDENSVPRHTFNFTPLSTIQDFEIHSIIDIIGICQSADDVRSTAARSRVRNIVLVDQSNVLVTVALWDTIAEEFNGTQHPVVAVQRARIKKFGGAKYVSVTGHSVFLLNPDIPKAHQLREWFNSNNREAHDCHDELYLYSREPL